MYQPKWRHLRLQLATAATLAWVVVGLGGAQAGASDLQIDSEVGQLVAECTANDGVSVFGQVWDDADGDEQLLNDAGIAGVEVTLDLPSLAATQTDELGFWAYCITDFELLPLTTQLTVAIPGQLEPVTPGVGPEDEDSDLVDRPTSATAATVEFQLLTEFEGRDPETGEVVVPQFEVDIEQRTLRIDSGFGQQRDFNPCPEWSVDLVDADPEGDWDSDGIVNRLDSLPCDRGIANPCPEWSDQLREVDPLGDWDGDGISNIEDNQPCETERPPPANPCDSGSSEIPQLAALSPAEDWDNDGLANGNDPLPCEAGIGNPCPDWNVGLLEFEPNTDWDGDGEPNSLDPLPCDVGVPSPCPDVNDLWIEQDPGGDWDDDGLFNSDDPNPCVPVQPNPCPNWTADLVENDPLGNWDGDSILNIEDEAPCDAVAAPDPCPNWTTQLVDEEPLADWDEDGIYNLEDTEPCGVRPGPCGTEGADACPDPCLEPTAEQIELDQLGDWDGDGASNSEDEDPCDPAVPGESSSGGGFPWGPWGPLVAVAAVVGGGGIALTGRGDDELPQEKKKKKPKAKITGIDLS